jgi:hypothetical protein
MTDDRAPDRVRLSEADARALVQRGRAAITKAIEAMAELRAVLPVLWEGRAWTVLGYESWEAMCQAEFGVRLPRVERKQLAGELAAGGMGVRAIAFGLGVDPATISRDLQPESVANATPAPTVANATPAPMTYPRWLATTGIPALTQAEFDEALAVISAELEACHEDYTREVDAIPREHPEARRPRSIRIPETQEETFELLDIMGGGVGTEKTRLKYPRVVAAARAVLRTYRARLCLLRLWLVMPEDQEPGVPDMLVDLIEEHPFEPPDSDEDKIAAWAELVRIADGETWNRMDRAVVAAALDLLLAPESAIGSEQPAE